MIFSYIRFKKPFIKICIYRWGGKYKIKKIIIYFNNLNYNLDIRPLGFVLIIFFKNLLSQKKDKIMMLNKTIV